MKIAIYSPYLDTLGGGERYMMTIAETFSKSHQVEVLLDRHLENLGADELKKKLASRFDLDLAAVRFIGAPMGEKSSMLFRMSFLRKYDVLFFLTDGSIFYPTAKKNILHIQSPLVGQPAKSLWGEIKLQSWDLIIYNSIFTKKHSQKNWPIKSEIVYPPVDVDKIKPLQKKKYILSVGRFFAYLKDKKQDVLIRAFKKLYQDKNMKGWSLHLAGSAGQGDIDYLKQLQELAKDLPINFYPNLRYDELVKLYGQSSIYWHAAGFDEEEPAKMEHFGIATVEAMAGGCVPVVIGKGGQKEIIDNKKSGFLWDNLEELEDATLRLVRDQKRWQQMSETAAAAADFFSKEKFQQKIKALI